jgi:hypothetical protein
MRVLLLLQSCAQAVVIPGPGVEVAGASVHAGAICCVPATRLPAGEAMQQRQQQHLHQHLLDAGKSLNINSSW